MMTRLTEQEAMLRHERAAAIIEDYEREYGFKLPEPWPETIEWLLLKGLTDPELHQIFNTIMVVEHKAGRLPDHEPDYKTFVEK